MDRASCAPVCVLMSPRVVSCCVSVLWSARVGIVDRVYVRMVSKDTGERCQAVKVVPSQFTGRYRPLPRPLPSWGWRGLRPTGDGTHHFDSLAMSCACPRPVLASLQDSAKPKTDTHSTQVPTNLWQQAMLHAAAQTGMPEAPRDTMRDTQRRGNV